MRDGFRVYDSTRMSCPPRGSGACMSTPIFGRGLRARTLPGPDPAIAEHPAAARPIGSITKYYRRSSARRRLAEDHSGRESNCAAGKFCRGPACRTTRLKIHASKDWTMRGRRHFLIPASWVGIRRPRRPNARSRPEPRLSTATMADFCVSSRTGLKGLIRAPARDVDAAVKEIANGAIRVGSGSPTVARQHIPADHPDLEPIWRAAAITICRSCTTARPGTRPTIPVIATSGTTSFSAAGVASLGRDALVASFIGGGILDRHPSLRMGPRCGFGWLPFWGRRM